MTPKSCHLQDMAAKEKKGESSGIKMNPLVFTVERSEPELIPPSKPTPYEFKYLSNLDNQKSLRKQNSVIQLYRHRKGMEGRDPVKIIKDAIGKTLVHYYPYAGRLREGLKDKLVVECTGEGILFIEGNASISLDHFGDVLLPPFPCAKELLSDVPASLGVLHCPLLFIQVTRLICGGFIVAFRLSHVINDATGFLQFMTALGEMACGASFPSVEPIWERELLSPREPPKVSYAGHVRQGFSNTAVTSHNEKTAELVRRSFFFGLEEIAELKDQLPTHLRRCTKVEILVACLWKCRTIALGLGFDQEIALSMAVNARTKFSPPLPVGYYGNAFGKPAVMSTAGELSRNSLGYGIELIQRSIAEVTDEFMRSRIDQLEITNPPRVDTVPTFHVSDLTKMRFADVDFGWGKAAYGGPIGFKALSTFLVSSINKEGANCIVVIIDLPKASMEKFATEIGKIIKFTNDSRSTFLKSPL